jgi:hypothetical protein
MLFIPLLPWFSANGVRHMIVVPHRGLHLLPPAAWFTSTGRRRRYVGDRFDVTVALSLALLNICRERVVECADRGACQPLDATGHPVGAGKLVRARGQAIRPVP